MVLLAAIVFALDRAMKVWAYDRLRALPGGTRPLWENVLHLTYASNEGISFSMLSGNKELLIIIGAVICVLIAAALIAWGKRNPGIRALGWIMLGGALGNLYDRIRFGFVIDMFEIRLFRFAIFNVADVFLCVGAALIALTLLFAPSGSTSSTKGRTR